MDGKIKKLIDEAAGGSVQAFGRLYEIYASDMYRFALSICKNQADAEDAVQETVISVYKSMGLIQDKGRFKAYLFTALSNTCKKKMAGRVYTDELSENTEARENRNDFEFDLEIREALYKLQEEPRKILVLSVVAGFKSGEIGKMLGMPASTVRTKLKRALEFMRKELSE